MLPERVSFSGYIQNAWDATSLSAFMKCPTLYHYSIVQGYRPHSSSVHLEFGTKVHRGLEIYDTNRHVLNMAHDEAQAKMVHQILSESYVREIVSSELTHDGIGLEIESGAYWRTNESNKNLWTLIRTLVWHTEAFQHESATILKVGKTHAIELPFSYEIMEGVSWCGHIDKIVEADGIWVRDYKTTKNAVDQRYFAQYEPSTQLPGYALAAKIVFHQPVLGVQVDAMQIGVSFTRMARGTLTTNQESEDEWMNNARYHIKSARALMEVAQGDVLKMPRNTEACFGCRMRIVCAKPPSVRKHFLEGNFEQKFWDPIKHREAT